MLRPWQFVMDLNRESNHPVYLQIATAIILDIQRGRLGSGSVLPSSRSLAVSLGVNRKTVVLAYDELVSQGWINSDTTRGTFISSELPTVNPQTPHTSRARRLTQMRKTPDYSLALAGEPFEYPTEDTRVMSFDDGLADVRLMPVEELARAWRRAVIAMARRNPSYGDARGTEQLRRAVSVMLNIERGMATRPENICIVRGSQMGIFIAAKILIRPGDVVVVESLSYPPAREAFRAAGAEVVSVDLDEHGLRVDALELLCRRRKVRAIYLTPHHQLPTTVLLKPERRLRLLLLAEQFGFVTIEDDYDHDFHFTHRPVLPLASMDAGAKTIYIGSLSKLLSPTMRLGYMAAPAPVIDAAARQIMLVDRQGDPVTEIAVAALIEQGALRRHANKARRIYAQRRQYFANLLNDSFRDDVTFVMPEGGLALWVNFDNRMNIAHLTAAARAAHLRFLAAQIFSFTAEPLPAARLGYAKLNQAEMDQAVSRLKRAMIAAKRPEFARRRSGGK
jgi:GntR family transcriptional regulator/MocR family aminotransferase